MDKPKVTSSRPIVTGATLIPQGVKFIPKPISGTMATLVPKLRANRSMPFNPSALGNSAARREYPGKNKMTGKEKIIRMILSGIKAMITNKIAVQAQITNRIFWDFIRNFDTL